MEKRGYELIDNIDRQVENGMDVYDAVVEECLTYGDYGVLISWLLEYFSGSNGFDEEAMELVSNMYEAYREDR